jgi:hypothetical protein
MSKTAPKLPATHAARLFSQDTPDRCVQLECPVCNTDQESTEIPTGRQPVVEEDVHCGGCDTKWVVTVDHDAEVKWFLQSFDPYEDWAEDIQQWPYDGPNDWVDILNHRSGVR